MDYTQNSEEAKQAASPAELKEFTATSAGKELEEAELAGVAGGGGVTVGNMHFETYEDVLEFAAQNPALVQQFFPNGGLEEWVKPFFSNTPNS